MSKFRTIKVYYLCLLFPTEYLILIVIAFLIIVLPFFSKLVNISPVFHPISFKFLGHILIFRRYGLHSTKTCGTTTSGFLVISIPTHF